MELKWLEDFVMLANTASFSRAGVALGQLPASTRPTRVDELRLRGFAHEELIGRDELKRLVPAVSDHCPGGVVSRRDGAADPFITTQAFRRRAVERGVVAMPGRQGRPALVDDLAGAAVDGGAQCGAPTKSPCQPASIASRK